MKPVSFCLLFNLVDIKHLTSETMSEHTALPGLDLKTTFSVKDQIDKILNFSSHVVCHNYLTQLLKH